MDIKDKITVDEAFDKITELLTAAQTEQAKARSQYEQHAADGRSDLAMAAATSAVIFKGRGDAFQEVLELMRGDCSQDEE